MLIMRTYALYERSRKVLAMYIVIVVAFMAVSCVSLNLWGNRYLVRYPIAYVVLLSGQQWFQNKINIRTVK